MPSGACKVSSDVFVCFVGHVADRPQTCLVMLCLVYVMAYEWYLGYAGLQAPYFGIELQTYFPHSLLLQELKAVF